MDLWTAFSLSFPQISSTSAKELLSGVMEKDAGHDDQAMVQELSDLAEPAIAANSCKAGCERGIVRALSRSASGPGAS